MNTRRILAGMGASLAVLAASGSMADAAVIFSTGSVTPLPGVHSSSTQSGSTVFGDLVTTHDVTFTSDVNLATNGGGVSQIDGPWSTISYGMTDGSGMAITDFSVDVTGNCRGCTVLLDAVLVGGGDITGTLGLGNGDNKFNAVSSGGDLIKTLTIEVFNAAGDPLSVDSLRQVKIGLASAVPEPATWLMLIIGVGGIGAVLRRARRGDGSAAVA
jgi:hypothetical protein